MEKSLRAIERGDVARAYERSSSRYARPVPVDPGTGELGATAWVLDEARIEEDARCDGYYCIVTSEEGMADGEVIEAYRGLWRIEESFRVVKGEMDARPVYLSTEAHIRAHFLVCFIALLVMRLMQADVERLTGSRPSAGACMRRCRTWSATASTPATGCSTTARTSPTRSGRPWASTSAAAWPQGAACGTSWRP